MIYYRRAGWPRGGLLRGFLRYDDRPTRVALRPVGMTPRNRDFQTYVARWMQRTEGWL